MLIRDKYEDQMSLASNYESCSCDWDSAPEFMCERVKTARKAWTCNECHCPIKPGEKYKETAGKWEGDFSSWQTCMSCVELCNWARISVPCFCWTYGEIIECIHNLVDEARGDMPPGWMFEWGRRMVKINRRRSECGRKPFEWGRDWAPS